MGSNFEKGLENWDFYVVKIQARQGSGSNFCEGPGLGLGSRSIFKARDRPGIDFLGLDPSLVVGHGMDVKNGIHHDQVRHFFEVLRYQNLEANKTFLLTEQ